jgi:hypothetical protein
MNYFKILFTFTLFALLCSSCFINKKTIVVPGRVLQRNTSVIDSFTHQSIKYKTLKYDFDATIINSEESTDLNGTLKIIKDSAIWISLSPGLGIEAARAILTQDSIKFINRINSEYFKGDYIYLKENFNLDVDFKTVQSLLTTESIIGLSYEEYCPKKLPNSFLIDTVLCTILKVAETQRTSYFAVDKGTFKIQNIFTENSSGEFVNIVYKNYSIKEKVSFPDNIHIQIKGNLKNLAIDIIIKNLNFDKKLKLSFSIPTKYTPTVLKNNNK